MTSPTSWLKTALAGLAILIFAMGPAAGASFVPGRGLNMDIWVLWPDEAKWGDRDVMLPFPEWRQHVNDEQLRLVRESGIDTIRIPVDPRPFLSSTARPLHDDLKQSVIASVSLLRDAGFKVIVDLHVIPDGNTPHRLFTDEKLWADYRNLVEDFADRLSGFDPENVAFELINEPPTECTPAYAPEWQSRMETLHKAARSAAPRLSLIVTGGCMSHADGLAALESASFDDETLFTFHSYSPFLLTHQGATWAGDVAPHVAGLPFPPYGRNEARARDGLEMTLRRVREDASFTRRAGISSYIEEQFALIDTEEELAAEMAAPFETAAEWAREHDIDPARIFLGEFGMIRQEYGKPFVTDPVDRAAYYQTMIELAASHGFGWAMWGWGGAFGVVYAFEGPAEPNVLDMVRDLPARPTP